MEYGEYCRSRGKLLGNTGVVHEIWELERTCRTSENIGDLLCSPLSYVLEHSVETD